MSRHASNLPLIVINGGAGVLKANIFRMIICFLLVRYLIGMESMGLSKLSLKDRNELFRRKTFLTGSWSNNANNIFCFLAPSFCLFVCILVDNLATKTRTNFLSPFICPLESNILSCNKETKTIVTPCK